MTALIALETSTLSGSVALLLDGETFETTLAGERAHASDLLPALDGLLRAHGRELGSLDAVAVGLGPGSYTGLRVGCATALGLARGADLPLVGVPSFEVAAVLALSPGEEGAVVLDARSGAIYHARYARHAEGVRVVSAPAVSPPAQIVSALAAPLALIGDEAALVALDLGDEARSRLRAYAPRAAVLARLGATRLATDGPSAAEAIEPLYLRPFAARRAR